jgi:hypothetical protein
MSSDSTLYLKEAALLPGASKLSLYSFSIMATTQSLNSDDARLAELGYKQEFKRHFTLWETFGLSFSMVTVAPGIA